MQQQILVVGIGNTLRSDDGVGVHVVRRLQEEGVPQGVEAEAIESSLISLLWRAREYNRVVVVDAIKPQGSPGKVHRFDQHTLTLASPHLLSLHQMSILDVAALIKMQDVSTEFIFIGVEAKTIEWGELLSPVVAQAIPEVLRQLRMEIDPANIQCSS